MNRSVGSGRRARPRAMRRKAGVLPLALAVTVAAVLTAFPAGPAHADTAPAPGSVVPDEDPFYDAPADIASYQPGEVVATRPVTPKGLTGVSAWQISFRTNDAHDSPELAVTTLLEPRTPWRGTGPRPVVSVQVAEDSTGTQCAPSYGLASGNGVGAIIATGSAQPILDRGWAAVLPDFEGAASAFMDGLLAGHVVLDSIRATRSAGLGGVGTANPWAVEGYSGGAQATGWAAQLQRSYAPDVQLVGAAIGGIPADPAAVSRYIDGGLVAGFVFAATAGFDSQYPEAGIGAILNAAGRKAMANARGICIIDLLVRFAFRKLADHTTVRDPLAIPSVARVLAANTLGAAAPTMPIYDYHADTDEIVPVAQDNTLVSRWCAAGATVHTVRDLIGEHALEAIVRQNDKLAFLSDRFGGRAPTNTCPR
ncbi:Triacylglycerol lipase [Parafrankia sp. EUN1f]|nr:Triacylglycerol lipase [Parafrankia sp. EUN1f]